MIQGKTLRSVSVLHQPLKLAGNTYNLRKLHELPYHLICSERWEELKSEVLCNFQWLSAKIKGRSLRLVWLFLRYLISIRESYFLESVRPLRDFIWGLQVNYDFGFLSALPTKTLWKPIVSSSFSVTNIKLETFYYCLSSYTFVDGVSFVHSFLVSFRHSRFKFSIKETILGQSNFWRLIGSYRKKCGKKRWIECSQRP